MYLYAENIKNPNLRFEVIEYDKETKMGKLRGEYGAEFTRELSKEAMKKFGYKIVQSETKLPLTVPPEPKASPKKKKAPVDDEDE
jgi:hypothetical protein